jgi:hypothetical protein
VQPQRGALRALIARSASWERGRPARNERFSAKSSRSVGSQPDAINSTQPLTDHLFAPYGAQRAGRPRSQYAAAYSTQPAPQDSISCGFLVKPPPVFVMLRKEKNDVHA